MSNERAVNGFWNASGGKNKQNVPAPLQRSLDAIDLAAAREGKARQYFGDNELKPILGRRIGKDSRKRDGFAKTAGHKAARSIVKDTVKVYRTVVKNPSL